MNIFVLDDDPKVCAMSHCDKHVVKMILETAQMICTTHHMLPNKDTSYDIPYKQTQDSSIADRNVTDFTENYTL